MPTPSYKFVTEPAFSSSANMLGASCIAIAADGSRLAAANHEDGTFINLGTPSGSTYIKIAGRDASAAAISNDTFAVAVDLGKQIGFRLINSAGDMVGSGSTLFVGDLGKPKIASLTGGSFVIACESTLSSSNSDIRLSVHGADGSLLKSIIVDNGLSQDTNATIVGLQDGGFAVAWQRTDGVQADLMYAVYGADGTVRKAPAFADTYGLNAQPQMVTLKDGGFALVYEDSGWSADGTTELTLVRYDANGTKLGSYVNLTNTEGQGDELLAVTVLENGMMVVVSGDGGENGAITLVDPATGQVLQQSAFDYADGLEGGLHIAARPDGGFAIIRTSDATVIVTEHAVERALYGDDTTETMTGDSLNDYLIGFAGADTLYGGGGDDILNGGRDADKMYGQAGDDELHIGFFDTVAGEIVNGGQGYDSIVSSSADLSQLKLVSIEQIELYGSGGAGSVAARAAQVGDGLSSALHIVGNGKSNDQVELTMGADTHLDLSGFTFSTADGDPSLTVMRVFGDGDSETIIGSVMVDDVRGAGGADLLNGGGGKDILRGGLGDDVYIVDQAGEAIEAAGQGLDWVKASVHYTLGANVEKLSLVGSANLNGTGNILGNRMVGNAGNNLLNGREGKDVLAGGAGADGFIFNTALNALTNVDLINDFQVGIDKIRLDDAIFEGLTGANKAAAFHVGSAAVAADDRIIYNSATGALLFDADGKGGEAAVRFATLDAGLDLQASDIVII